MAEEPITWGIPGWRQDGHEGEEEQALPAPPILQSAAHRAYEAYLRTYPRPQDGDYTARSLLRRAAAGQPLVRPQLPQLAALCREWAGKCTPCQGSGVYQWAGDSRVERQRCAHCQGTGVQHG